MRRVVVIFLVAVFGLTILTLSGANAATNGPLRRYSKNPTRFADQNNNPVWLMGMTACCKNSLTGDGWPLVSLTRLDEIADHGGNFVHIRTGPFTNEEGGTTTYEAYARAQTNPVKYDLNRWNEGFWKLLQNRIEYARSKNIYVEVDLIDIWLIKHSTPEFDTRKLSPWNKENNVNGIDQGSCDILRSAPTAVHEKFLRKVVATTGEYDNVIYQVGNESYGCNRVGINDSHMTQWYNEVISIVKSELSNRGYLNKLISTNSHRSVIEELSGIDYVNIHQEDAVSPRYGKPTGINEYESGFFSTDAFTKTLWESFTKHTFFHIWKADTPDYPGTLARMKHFMNFVKMTKFGDYKVLGTNFTGIPGEEYVVYDDAGRWISVNLSSASSSTRFSVTWYNARRGEQRSGGTVTGGGVRIFTSPFSGKTVLLLKKSSGVTTPNSTKAPGATNTPTPNPNNFFKSFGKRYR